MIASDGDPIEEFERPVTKLSLSDNSPSVTALRRAITYVFNELEWSLILHRGQDVAVHVHGGIEFEEYRSGPLPAGRASAARRDIVQAIVDIVRRTRIDSVLLSVGGLAGLDAKPAAWANASARLRARLKDSIDEAITRDGHRALLDLREQSPPIPFGPFDRAKKCAPPPERQNELDEMLLGIEEPADLPGLLRQFEGRTPLPDPPTLPMASTADLSKAVKYVFTSPLNVTITAQRPAPISLKVRGGAQAQAFLRGAMSGTGPNNARCAMALTVRYLVETTDDRAFDLIAPPSIGAMSARLSRFREHLIQTLTATVKDDGHAGLVRLCRSGL